TEKKRKSGTIDVKALLAGDEEFLRALVRTALEEVLEAEMAPGAQRCGQAADKPWAESPSSLHGRPLRLARIRCQRGSAGVVLPASSRFKPSRTEDTGMRIIGLDIHRAFAEAVAWENGNLSRLGRVIMRREPLEEFAKQLSSRDVLVIEATGNAASVAA